MVDSSNRQLGSNVAPEKLALDVESREQLSALRFIQSDDAPGHLSRRYTG